MTMMILRTARDFLSTALQYYDEKEIQTVSNVYRKLLHETEKMIDSQSTLRCLKVITVRSISLFSHFLEQNKKFKEKKIKEYNPMRSIDSQLSNWG